MHLVIQKCQTDSIMFARGIEQFMHVHFMAVADGLC